MLKISLKSECTWHPGCGGGDPSGFQVSPSSLTLIKIFGTLHSDFFKVFSEACAHFLSFFPVYGLYQGWAW